MSTLFCLLKITFSLHWPQFTRQEVVRLSAIPLSPHFCIGEPFWVMLIEEIYFVWNLLSDTLHFLLLNSFLLNSCNSFFSVDASIVMNHKLFPIL